MWNYFLPYANYLTVLKRIKAPTRGFLVGVSAIQGAGKSTQGDILELLFEKMGYYAVSRSIDDHYVTHQELSQLNEGRPSRHYCPGINT